ncbi:ATP-binding cassette domain-containing protein [Rhizobium sp. P32RR-XVIII]|uniref:ABC transporter ATP-binding protein n=1 Tax=Rhizobium sp. P32RR-XVIII TaxID=2726738 RepID=UPI0014571E79|nr:oligopeptide/dipeptide ABC transporter ATP-binding protein [Rhizobium sp. P32RR-XVIII]NLS07280.1 ATP-binding cassette domain-containing protein [Rhizobium sp. P32RR-XVIII]
MNGAPILDPAAPGAVVPQAILQLDALGCTFTRQPLFAERLLGLLGRPPEISKVRAVRSIDLTVRRGEVLGLVGESGCGKSTLGRMISGIIRPSEGTIRYNDVGLDELSTQARRDFTLGVQMIFQDPYASLNPRQRVGDILAEPLRVHGLAKGKLAIRERVDAALAEVGLDPSYRSRYPHQFSGGQRQRIGIARALIVEPEFLVCDEPIAALDVSIQAQVINLFLELRAQRALTYLFISHDLSIVHHIADRVAIMYLGKIVELGPAAELFAEPAHPYTRTLLAEIPSVKKRRRTFNPVKGELPSPLHPPTGCAFHPRCPAALARCRIDAPLPRAIGPGRTVSCHLFD